MPPLPCYDSHQLLHMIVSPHSHTVPLPMWLGVNHIQVDHNVSTTNHTQATVANVVANN